MSMTTLAALATKDALVMGCDSLGSVTREFVDPFALLEFFDYANNFKIKTDTSGKPLLDSFNHIYNKSQIIPYNHMTHVNKLFSLYPLPMGVMITGIASIGDFTIKNLVNQFRAKDPIFKTTKKPRNYTVHSIAKKLLKFIKEAYDKEYGSSQSKPTLEMIIGGYDKQKHIPTILRIYVHKDEVQETLKDFGIVFGGQMTEIQRLVFGTDLLNKLKLTYRTDTLFRAYHNEVTIFLRNNNIDIDIPKPDTADKYKLFSQDWDIDGFDAVWGDFSEKNAVECVKFFIDIMVKSQQYSSRMPTVGGDIHIALVTKTDGFRPFSNTV